MTYREGSWTRGSGSAYRLQRNAYAYAVSAVMAGKEDTCPSCEGPLDLANRGGEVDRVDPTLDYRPGNVCYLCRDCNSARGVLQTSGGDWRNVAAYAEAVRVASLQVTVPTVTQAKAWWASLTTHVAVARVRKWE